nr:MAG TPA: hypothetical protein [Caudoviricetes sp.]
MWLDILTLYQTTHNLLYYLYHISKQYLTLHHCLNRLKLHKQFSYILCY